MTSSDNDFDDDDDDFLLALTTKKPQELALGGSASAETASTVISTVHTTQARPSGQTPSSSIGTDPSIQAKLYRADGEIAILREKYQQLQNLRQLELAKLKESQQSVRRQNEEQLKALQFTVQKLEDEKRFLNNEIKGIASKRRKVRENGDDMEVDGVQQPIASTSSSSASASVSVSAPSSVGSTGPRVSSSQVVRILNDTSLFFDHIWNYCISGARRTSLTFLSKIYVERDISIRELYIRRKVPLSIAIVDYLMMKKKLRLDELVSEFTSTVAELVELLLEQEKLILSVPYLLSLIHAAISYRPLAVVKHTIVYLLKTISKISGRYLFLLEETQHQEDYITYHDVPEQVLVLEKITLLFSVDIVEKLSAVSTLHGTTFVEEEIWGGEQPSIPRELIRRLLPENTERLKSTSQINLVYNIVEMLMASITEELFAYSKVRAGSNHLSPIFNSLFKVLLIDIPRRDEFMVYGLNRILGNNIDIKKVESLVPLEENVLGYSLVLIPSPIPQELKSERRKELLLLLLLTEVNELEARGIHNKLNFELNSKHQNHLLKLRIRVTVLVEHFIVSTSQIGQLQLKDYIKSIVRTIGFEQSNILKSPRSKDVHLRTQLIVNLVRILHYVSSDTAGGLTNLVYPETMYEIYVSLLRIAFGSNSLSGGAHSLLKSIRSQPKHFNLPVFNKWCELRAKQLNHIDQSDNDESKGSKQEENAKFIADIESQYANGLEFPYDEEAVELAREILDQCVTHEEADNLFFNMNYEDPNLQDEYTKFDEMDLVN